MKPILCEYCKRERVKQNDTNWNRHIESCKKKTQMCNKRQKGNLDRFISKKAKSCIVDQQCNTSDAIIISISTRFYQSREILKDLCLLSPQRILKYSNGVIKTLPEDAFNEIEDWLPGININVLKNEYLTLSLSLKSLLDSYPTLPKRLHKNISKEQNECFESSADSDGEENTSITSQQIIKVLSNYNLSQNFPNLYLAYKGLLTIPASSASAERAFSKVKLIKTRLRSTIGQDRLESLMILSCERDISINYEEAINVFAMSSDLLKDKLIFK